MLNIHLFKNTRAEFHIFRDYQGKMRIFIKSNWLANRLNLESARIGQTMYWSLV